MCVYSMVHDHFWPRIPEKLPEIKPVTWPTWPPPEDNQPELTAVWAEIERIKKLIEEFREAGKAAEKVDKLTGQPDCVDPEKAKLQERVAELEKQIKKLERRKKRNKRGRGT